MAFIRRPSVNTSLGSSTASTTASPTQVNGGGAAVTSPNNSLMYQLDGYKSLISKSKLASPHLHSDGPVLGDHGEDHTPTSPIAVPIKDFDRRASTPSTVVPASLSRGFDVRASTPTIAMPVPLARGFDGRTSTTSVAMPTLCGRDFDGYASTPPIGVPTSLARGFEGRAPTAPVTTSALSGRDFDVYASTPLIAVPTSLARGFDGHASTPPPAGLTPLAKGFDGRISTPSIAMPSSLARGSDGRAPGPTVAVPSPLARDLDGRAPTPSMPMPILSGRDFGGGASATPSVAPASLAKTISGHASVPPVAIPAPPPKSCDGWTSIPSIALPTPPVAESYGGTSVPSIAASTSLSRELEDGNPIAMPTPPDREVGGGNQTHPIVASTPPAGGLEGGAPTPSIAVSTPPVGEFEGGTSTPSISVSTHPASYSDSAVGEELAQEGEPCPQPPRGEGAGGPHRRMSISFDPNVTLDNGCQYALEQPLPKPKSGIDIGLRGRSMLKELADEQEHHAPARAHSDSERTQYDPITGEHVHHGRRIGSENNMSQLQPGQSHYPLIQSTIDELARNSDLQGRPRMPSLTSEITASPLIEEVHTPLRQPAEYSLSPLGMYPHLDEPTSLLETSAWPTIPRSPRVTAAHRSFSQSLDKRGIKHRSRRTQSERSPSGNSMSPASAYLSMWVPAGKTMPSEPDDEGQEVGAYVIGKQIGFGGFSVVKEAFTIENDDRIRRAVKIVRKRVVGKEERENERLQTEFEHEVLLWRLLNHRHILPLIAVYDTDFATFCFTQLNTGGTLFDLVRDNRKGLKSELARRYSFQLASALRYLHEDMHVVHRDIKLENCLLDMTGPHALTEGGNLLLCDFGMAEFVTSDGTAETRDGSQSFENIDRLRKNIGPSETSTSIVGSLQYAAPELVNSSAEALTTAVDIWAFGVVVFCVLTGGLPFQDTFQPRVPLLIMRGDWDEKVLRSSQGVVASGDAVVEVVRGCLQLDIDIRWNVGQVLASDWLENCKEEDEDGWKF